MSLFTKSEIKKVASIKKDPNLLTSDCMNCGLYKKKIHPKIEISGEGKKGILIIGETITEEDETYGISFAGEEGERLSKYLGANKIDFHKDCWKIKAVRCQTDKTNYKQIRACYPYLEKFILTKKPKLVLLLGSDAISSFFGQDYSNREDIRWRGTCIPDQHLKCNIVPLFSITKLMENDKDKNLKCCFDRDFKFAIEQLKSPFVEQSNHDEYVTMLIDFKTLKSTLQKVLKKKPLITYDYETTGLKPFKKGHKIVTISFSVNETKAFSFPYQYRDFWTKKELKIIHDLWKKILKNSKIRKIAHNSKYEEIWGSIFFKARHKWHFDTLMCAHVLDNRKAFCGLKFQAFINFGVRPYDKEISKFLTPKGEFNEVEKAPLKDLLLYNGLDCIYTHMLYKKQIELITKQRGLLRAYNFFMNSNKEMASLQLNGFCMNVFHYKKTKKYLKKKIQKIEKRLLEGREARAFKKKYGKQLLLTSNQDLGNLFYNVLGKDPIYTKKNNYKTDKPTLEKLNLPFIKKLFEKKKYEKALGTYLGQFEREICGNKIYPFFDLIIPISYRSSSSSPNWQNQPKRDEEIKKLIRSGMIPRKNSVLSEIDFSGAEVSTSATYHKDQNFIAYLLDKSTDMHRDNATDLLLLPHETLERTDYNKEQKKRIKLIRFYAKNLWTFAQFYGDWYGSCAPNFWEIVVEGGLLLPDGTSCKDWLASQGIYELGEFENGRPTPGSFLEHCQKVEDKMWNQRFPEYTQWKKDVVDFYQKYGYIENHFGFKFTGYMSRNQCTNFPVQSASFHLLLNTLIEVQRMIKRLKLKTKVCGQIHDSIIASVPKNEIQIYHSEVHKITKNLQNKFKWLIVPIEIEVEISKLREEGGSMAEMQEVDPDNAKLWN
jgi:uracil-DNA glycosylase family 4